MANGIILLALVAICVFAVRSYLRKLRHGCCGADSAPEERLKVRDKNPSHYPYTPVLRIDGMTCSRCKERVENAFHAEEGLWIQVDRKHGTAQLRAKQPPDRQALSRLVARAGYRLTEMDGSPV